MQELLAREEAHNRRLLKPFLDVVWSNYVSRHWQIFPELNTAYSHDGGRCWRRIEIARRIVTREVMEEELLSCLRYAIDIDATDGFRNGEKISVDAGKSYACATIESLSSGGDIDSPVTGLSFLRWEDEIALWRQVLDERLAGKPVF